MKIRPRQDSQLGCFGCYFAEISAIFSRDRSLGRTLDREPAINVDMVNEPKLDLPLLIHACYCTDILVASYMSMQLVCTSKNIWAELSYEFGPSCLINLGRVGMGRALCGPSFMWAELVLGRIVHNSGKRDRTCTALPFIKLKMGQVCMGRVMHLGPSFVGQVGFGAACPAPTSMLFTRRFVHVKFRV